MFNYKIRLKYDGKDFFGYAIQKDKITVQGILEKSLKKILNEEITIWSSGRTDRGVHANDQVISFFSKLKITPDNLTIALNNQTPKNIEIKSTIIMDQDFNARFSVKNKTYKYIINNGEYNIFKRDYEIYIFRKIDFLLIKEASKEFIGKHDFASFSTTEKENTIRDINSIEILKNKNDIITIKINANGFLKYMVRMIVAKIINIGLGKINNINSLLDNPKKGSSILKAPPEGLYLDIVNY